MSRVRDHVEPVTLHPVSPSMLTTAERAAFLASLRAEECPVCEGSGGTLLDDWGYERADCRACGGTGLRAARVRE
jgi:DnaJ-class molecular chaperone